jgi:hypothetical protein
MCAQVERAGSIYAQEAEAVQVRRPAEDACTGEEKNAEGEGKGDNKRRVVESIVHYRCFKAVDMRAMTGCGGD